MKLYDLVKDLLEEKPERRDSDKKLIWAVWHRLGYAEISGIDFVQFMSKGCPSPESITRCRRKLQEKYPNLKASAVVELARREKEQEKGTFVYRESADVSNSSAINVMSAMSKNPKWEELRKKLHTKQ